MPSLEKKNCAKQTHFDSLAVTYPSTLFTPLAAALLYICVESSKDVFRKAILLLGMLGPSHTTTRSSLILRLHQGNTRTTGILVAAHENGLKLDLVETRPMSGVSDDYRKLNKLGKIPTFEGADNFVLSESMAIAIYGECHFLGSFV